MLKNKKLLILTTVLLLLPMAAGLALWNSLPEQLPTHWNAAGEVDGWSGRGFAAFGLPAVLLAIHWLCVLATGADPKRKNQSEKLQLLVLWICPVLSVVVMSVVYATALGREIPMQTVMPVLVGVLLVIIGNYLPKCRQNYTMGIKLPWTLSSEENWNATHRLAGFLWVIGGLVLIPAALLLPDAVLWVLLPLLLALAVVPAVYSYVYHRRHGGEKE